LPSNAVIKDGFGQIKDTGTRKPCSHAGKAEIATSKILGISRVLGRKFGDLLNESGERSSSLLAFDCTVAPVFKPIQPVHLCRHLKSTGHAFELRHAKTEALVWNQPLNTAVGREGHSAAAADRCCGRGRRCAGGGR
jgi:hypothetical protein